MILDGQALLTQSFLYTSTGTANEKMNRICATQYTAIDVQIALIKLLNSINDNSGQQLDDLGTNLDMPRVPGQSDAEYRVYLSVAIASQESSGTIPQMVSIGKAISGATAESTFRPFELWRLTGSVLLDNTWALDASKVMAPGVKDPGNVEGMLEGDVDTMGVPLAVGDIIQDVKAAGVAANFQIGFNILASKCTLGTGDPTRVSTMKLYNGASVLKTGTVSTKIRTSDGAWCYYLTIPTTDMNSDTVNKVAVFDPFDNEVASYTFTGKPKKSSLEYQWIYIDDINI